MNLPLQSAVPLLFVLSFVHYFVFGLIWGYLPNYNPITIWLLECCAGEAYFKAVVYAHDFALNTIFSLPLAWFIAVLQPKKTALYLACAVLPSFAFSYYHVISTGFEPFGPWTYAPGAVMHLLWIPTAYTLLMTLANRKKSVIDAGQ